jgi:hypothetical protein
MKAAKRLRIAPVGPIMPAMALRLIDSPEPARHVAAVGAAPLARLAPAAAARLGVKSWAGFRAAEEWLTICVLHAPDARSLRGLAAVAAARRPDADAHLFAAEAAALSAGRSRTQVPVWSAEFPDDTPGHGRPERAVP